MVAGLNPLKPSKPDFQKQLLAIRVSIRIEVGQKTSGLIFYSVFCFSPPSGLWALSWSRTHSEFCFFCCDFLVRVSTKSSVVVMHTARLAFLYLRKDESPVLICELLVQLHEGSSNGQLKSEESYMYGTLQNIMIENARRTMTLYVNVNILWDQGAFWRTELRFKVINALQLPALCVLIPAGSITVHEYIKCTIGVR